MSDQEDALPALPEPVFIYHPESGTEGADDWVSDDLFEFAFSGAVDEGCDNCIRLYTNESLQNYARAALAARPVVDHKSETMSDKPPSGSPVIDNALPPLPTPAHPTHSIGPLFSIGQMQSYARAACADRDAEIARLRALAADAIDGMEYWGTYSRGSVKSSRLHIDLERLRAAIDSARGKDADQT